MTRLFLFTDNAVIEIAPKHPTVRALADVGRQTRNRGHALIRPDGTLVGGAAPK